MSTAAIWKRHRLPGQIIGQSFLDVGCWEGDMCREACLRQAARVLGVDYCTSPELARNLGEAPFEFLQLDILSEKALELPEFDIVYSAGVLYHLENPISFLLRLRKLLREGGVLTLETTCLRSAPPDVPLMVFHPGGTLDDNPSNWWSPNARCLLDMLEACGFEDASVVWQSPGTMATTDSPPLEIGRIVVRARKPRGTAAGVSEKVLPRRPAFMPASAGAGSRRAPV